MTGAATPSMPSAPSRSIVACTSGSGRVTRTRMGSAQPLFEPVWPGLGQQRLPDLAADGFGITTARFGPEAGLPIKAENFAAEGQARINSRSQGADGRTAGAIEHGEHGALGSNCPMRRSMIERSDKISEATVA